VKFFDEAFITVQSGDGGRGCVSFRREKFIPRGGPDGGDGGTGGNVIFVSSSHRRTLYPFRFKRQFKAQSGTHGQGKQKTGKKGDDLIIEIPPGTLIFDEETNEIIKDFTQPEETRRNLYHCRRRPWRPGKQPLQNRHPPCTTVCPTR